MTIAYLLLRVSDFLEDNHALPAGRKHDLLCLWDRILAGVAKKRQLLRALGNVPRNGGDADAEVAGRFPEIMHSLTRLPDRQGELVLQRVRETTQGMAQWQRRGALFEDEADLDDYMHYVAGVVGYMITEVFSDISFLVALRRDELMPLGREYGLGLQTVNIIRGIRKDYERGWLYIPRSFCEAEGIEAEELFAAEHLPRALKVVHSLADKAERHLVEGLAFVMKLPRSMHRVRLATMWPLLFAAKTVSVSRNNPDVLRGEAKISRRDVKAIIRHSTVMGWSNSWLQRYYRRLLNAPPAA